MINIPVGSYDLVVEHNERNCYPHKSLRTSDNGLLSFDSRAGYATSTFIVCENL